MEIYKENILNHYRKPHNYGSAAKPDFKLREENTFCGDWIEVSGTVHQVSGKKVLKELKFKGKGCVISQAASSMLTDYSRNKSIAVIKNLKTKDISRFLKINLPPTRQQCAELSLSALKKGLNNLNIKTK